MKDEKPLRWDEDPEHLEMLAEMFDGIRPTQAFSDSMRAKAKAIRAAGKLEDSGKDRGKEQG